MRKYQTPAGMVVEAGKVAGIQTPSDIGDRIRLMVRNEDGTISGHNVPDAWVRVHGRDHPADFAGGYYVRPVGSLTTYWCPPDQFEANFKALVDEDKPLPGLPVHGYRAQSQEAVDLVNSFKQAEERVLRLLDAAARQAVPGQIDQRWFAIGRTHLEQAFMAINRAVFQPGRVDLPEDPEDTSLRDHCAGE